MAALMRQVFCKINQFSAINNPNLLSKNVGPILSYTCEKFYANAPTPYEVIEPKTDKKKTSELISKINEQVSKGEQGRLFAVVHVAGKQFKITNGDVVVIEGYWPPSVGDKISLDKVLVAGGVDFTLIGRPLVQRGLVEVEATVIEKTLSHTKTHFRKKRRKQYKRINFFRIPQTMLRINKIEINGELNNPPEVTRSTGRVL